jgi:hypothetical protein
MSRRCSATLRSQKALNLASFLSLRLQVINLYILVIASTTGQVFNFENNLIEQGSTWVFRFTLAGSYGQNSTIRFVFPEGFNSNKVQCNITGIIDSTLQTRVFPQRNIFECLNVKASLSGFQNIILSGVVNPPYEMQMQGLQVQIIQPNNLVILEKISIPIQP